MGVSTLKLFRELKFVSSVGGFTWVDADRDDGHQAGFDPRSNEAVVVLTHESSLEDSEQTPNSA